MSKQRMWKQKQQGSILIFFAVMLVMLFGFGALAIDLGYAFLVRNQLQNAADTAALAGADALYPLTSTGAPNWQLAQTNAAAAVKLNKADTKQLTDAVLVTGYWDITGTTKTMKSTSTVPGQYDLAAIQVTIQKTSGKNGGPISLFLGPVIGIKTMDIIAQATAVVGAPATIKQGKLFPIAMLKSLYDTYWDSTKNSPKLDPKTGAAYSFQIASSGGGGGTWTTFNSNSNSSSVISGYITNGSPITYNIGDTIWISPGTKSGIYSKVPKNVDVLVPVVPNISNNGLQPILAFSSIHIDSVKTSGSGYIQVHFQGSYKVVEEDPGGISYGVYTSPRLAN